MKLERKSLLSSNQSIFSNNKNNLFIDKTAIEGNAKDDCPYLLKWLFNTDAKRNRVTKKVL